MQPGAARFPIPAAPAEASPEGEAGKYHDVMDRYIFEMSEIYPWPMYLSGPGDQNTVQFNRHCMFDIVASSTPKGGNRGPALPCCCGRFVLTDDPRSAGS